MNGILNINKPSGLTSHDVVLKLRRLLGTRKIGHTGTLDPLASGVLPLCVGQGTRIAQFISAKTKGYRAIAKLGVETDTLDRDGRILNQEEAIHIKQGKIEQVLPEFRGNIEQVPPMFSALKKNGQRLYQLARRGITVDRPPRPVQIQVLELIDFSAPYFTLEIECSAGTYVRSLVADIGKRLGCGATLWKLVRTRCGQFKLNDSLSLEQAKELVQQQQLHPYLISLNQALSHMPQLTVNEEAVRLIKNGVDLKAEAIKVFPKQEIEQEALLRLLSPSQELLALGHALQPINTAGKPDSEALVLHPQLVFS